MLQRYLTFHRSYVLHVSLLIGKACVVYVDDIFGKTKKELARHARLVFECLRRHRMYVSAAKSVFFTSEVKWCGKRYSAEGVHQDPERLQGLLNLRRP